MHPYLCTLAGTNIGNHGHGTGILGHRVAGTAGRSRHPPPPGTAPQHIQGGRCKRTHRAELSRSPHGSIGHQKRNRGPNHSWDLDEGKIRDYLISYKTTKHEIFGTQGPFQRLTLASYTVQPPPLVTLSPCLPLVPCGHTQRYPLVVLEQTPRFGHSSPGRHFN